MSYMRRHHPDLVNPLEAEVAIGSLTTVPPSDLTRSVVIAEDTDGRIHFASTLGNREIGRFLVDALLLLIAEVPKVGDEL